METITEGTKQNKTKDNPKELHLHLSEKSLGISEMTARNCNFSHNYTEQNYTTLSKRDSLFPTSGAAVAKTLPFKLMNCVAPQL